ncbi:EboA domain-containing protein [Plantactinospora sp. GCM10030261]|uniref:EboA domain-containing protein n=1 Tax=Plantactinospora sp. GCM10030261 TaxID=3273420 RepID=UPI0036145556
MHERPEELRAALAAVPDEGWLADAVRRVGSQPAALPRLFAAAGRRCGRAELPDAPGWSADDAARVVLLTALPPGEATARVENLYRHGDAAEKRAVLRALPMLPIGDIAVPLLHDAIRTNDTRLVSAALGGYARHLDQPAWRQAVLKLVFMGVSLSVVDRLDERADDELRVMLAGLAAERQAAGRSMPADALALLERLTSAGADQDGQPVPSKEA